MRRSRYVSLLVMGSASLLLTACDDPVETAAFENVKQCIDSKMYSEAECRESFTQAKEMHGTVAPTYASLKECEADFGAAHCETGPQATSSGHSTFIPMFMGYMIGRSLGSAIVPAQPLYRNYQGGTPGSFRTASNVEVARAPGAAKVYPADVKRPGRVTTLSRGGFGSRSFAGG